MKKIIKIVIFICLAYVILCDNCFAAEVLCHNKDVLKAMRVFSALIMIAKIIAPAIIIITGIIGFSKAVISGDDSSIKDQIRVLLNKVLVGVFVFFIPTIVYAVVSLAYNYDRTNAKFSDCGKCLTSFKTCNQLIARY